MFDNLFHDLDEDIITAFLQFRKVRGDWSWVVLLSNDVLDQSKVVHDLLAILNRNHKIIILHYDLIIFINLFSPNDQKSVKFGMGICRMKKLVINGTEPVLDGW